jgi:mRNA interferase HicA
MKTRDLIKKLEQNGWTFKRRGGKHDIYIKGCERESVPRHSETDEDLANAIIKRRHLK